MIWLLIVIHLNLTATPIQIHHGEVIATFPSHQACIKKHTEFFKKAEEEKRPIPPYFNLRCVPYKRTIM